MAYLAYRGRIDREMEEIQRILWTDGGTYFIEYERDGKFYYGFAEGSEQVALGEPHQFESLIPVMVSIFKRLEDGL